MSTTRHRLPSAAALRVALHDQLQELPARLARLRDPRLINPAYVFAAGLGVLVPIWLIFLNH
ncbi:MAG TPA: hypothetical protein VMB81_05580 [Candidatus Sulfotelmatobacter sp.]|nr:hypothetical protein [Candidatus Sulfotelmatobacter sp.]